MLVRAVEVREGSTLATRLGAGPEWAVVAVALAALVALVARPRPVAARGAADAGRASEKESA